MTPEPPPHPSGTSESRWQALTRGVPLYVATFSRDGYLTFLNRGQGIDNPAPFLGRHISELLPLGDGLDIRDAIDDVVGGASPVRLEIPAMLQDRMRWLELHLAPLREDERIVGVLAVGLDVTDSRQSAIELRMSVNALHRVIESREQLEADLHDSVLQSLFGVGLRLEAARAAARTNGVPGGGHLDLAVAQLNATMKEIRQFIAEGHSSAPPGTRWDEALAGILRGLEVENGPRIQLRVDPKAVARVSPPDQSDVVSIAREAVNNAVRHARARQIVVRLLDDGPDIRLEVEDDGIGFRPDQDVRGLGMLTMTRRASRIGAMLTVQSSPAMGTLIRLDLPVEEADGG
jgi:signal transduction histidine kinase